MYICSTNPVIIVEYGKKYYYSAQMGFNVLDFLSPIMDSVHNGKHVIPVYALHVARQITI